MRQGRRAKIPSESMDRYRLFWKDVVYQPGELKVVAYDAAGNAVAENMIKTAGKPYAVELVADRNNLQADGKDLSFVTVRVIDKDGNLCPTAQHQLKFDVKGAGSFKAVCNGDASSLEAFVNPTMKAFNGQLVVVLQSNEKAGDIQLKVSGKNLKTATAIVSSSLEDAVNANKAAQNIK